MDPIHKKIVTLRRSLLSASAVVVLAAGVLSVSNPAYADTVSFEYTVTGEDPSIATWVVGRACSADSDWINIGRPAVTQTASVSETGLYTFRDSRIPTDGRFMIFEGLFDRNDVSNCLVEVDDEESVELEAGVAYTMLLAGYGGLTGTMAYEVSGPGIFASTVTLLDATTALSASSGAVVAGDSVDLTATIARPGFSANFAGHIEFFDGGTSLGATQVAETGEATLPAVQLNAGSRQITAHYAGNAWVAPSISAPVSVEVEPSATTTVLSASAASVEAGARVSLSAEITGVAPTGTVEFFAGGTSLGSASVTAGVSTAPASAVLTTASLAVGTHSITAAYGGDLKNAASRSLVPLTLTVTAVPVPAPTRSPAPVPDPAPVPVTPVAKPDPAKNDTSAKQLATTGGEPSFVLLSGALTLVAGATLLVARQRARRTRQV